MLIIVGCDSEAIPKPKAYLSLKYPEKKYEKITEKRPYVFEIPASTKVEKLPKNWLKIKYPKLRASVDITYRPIQNNLKELLMEADKLVFEHTIKADNISSRDYANEDKKVFGKLYDISGNAASQVQFHVTDSAKHFLKASLFFYSKPNYDSVLPAVDYIKQDMIRMMESLEWND
jgi:gliding motility-associated lipoprotein GldD